MNGQRNQGVAAVVLALLLAGCGDIQAAIDQQQSAGWEGNWAVNSVTLDGASQQAYGARWSLSSSSWTLTTAVCAADGSTSADGNNLSLTVLHTSCPDTLPAPQGRTATGTADVNGDQMTLTLTHSIPNSGTHTLVTVCSRI